MSHGVIDCISFMACNDKNTCHEKIGCHSPPLYVYGYILYLYMVHQCMHTLYTLMHAFIQWLKPKPHGNA